LPEKDGSEVCRDLRRRRIHTPILLLTARDSFDDRVQGLDCGADDYLIKSLWVAHHGDRDIRVGDGRRPACVVDHVQDATEPGLGEEDREQILEA
jgi:CheY-like chemotaxis protein